MQNVKNRPLAGMRAVKPTTTEQHGMVLSSLTNAGLGNSASRRHNVPLAQYKNVR